MKTVNASIITIGDELLIGQTIDTNSAFIAQELNRIGVWVKRRVAVGDVWDEIWNALDEESSRSDIIIITGGLGPTADDITKPLLCRYFGGKLVLDEKVLAHVKYLFEQVYRRPGILLERNVKQAEVPDVCTVLHNARGTAPGMLFRKDGKVFFSLPGVPHEMKGLMTAQVIPVLQAEFTMPAIIHRTAFTSGIGESMIAELIKDFETALPSNTRLAYLPGYGMVKLRLTCTGENTEQLQADLENRFRELKEIIQPYLVSDTEDEMEKVIGTLLRARGKTMGTAESCTGGYIAHLLTSVAGSSDYFKGSVVGYANDVKTRVLDVDEQTLATAGAVSEETVRAMVKGALARLDVDYVVATSGIMGPGGGTDEKPVGMVWIAAGDKEKTIAKEFHFRFDRERNIRQAAFTALDFLRKFILSGQ